MKFLNPAGLWLLLGVPVLIIIYLIKSRHTDLPVSSTYLWRLSERFRKKRLPVQRFRNILLFLLQLLMIVAVSLLAAKPAVVNGERYDYIVLLDASASMNTRDDAGISRFRYAVKQTEELAEYVRKGHTLSVILASDTPSLLIEHSDSLSEIKHMLNAASCSFGVCDTATAMELAGQTVSRCENPRVIFYTDRDYAGTEGLTVVNLNKNEWNVSVDGLAASAEKERTVFTGRLTSHNLDADVAVGLRIDGKTVDARTVMLTAGIPAEVSFDAENLIHYDTAEVFIEENDGLAEDNSYALCRRNTGIHRVLLVSASPLYLESALNALGNCEVTVVPTTISTELSGYDLTICDNTLIDRYPDSGSVLLFGLHALPPGLTFGEIVAEETPLTIVRGHDSDFYDGLSLGDTVVSAYAGLIGDASWEPLLTCGDTPVLMTKEFAGGLRFSAASFDLHDSNLPMQSGFVTLIRNLVDLSVPAILRDTDWSVGETVTLTVLPEALQMYAELPDGTVRQFDTDALSCTLPVNGPGIHTAVMTTADGGEYVDFFVHLPAEESSPAAAADDMLSLSVDLPEGASDELLSEIAVWVAAVFLILLLIEWGCWYRDTY
ncbi:MAG: BatA and WFA domain-containing protein [Clostridia bacterium]|nr:BatA and WFA domain-containing protein [Clostridia bacterium]